jgi:serine/threonine-protein kinase RsbW
MPLKKLGELSVSSSQDSLTQVDNFAEKLIRKTCFGPGELDDVAIALSEAVNNAIIHGNKLDLTKTVNIKLYICNKYLRITVEDQGAGFNLKQVPDPREEENLLKASGRGLLIMRHLMDRIHFKTRPTGMKIIMEKDCPKG